MEIAAMAVMKIVVLCDMYAPSILWVKRHVGPIHKGLNGVSPSIRRIGPKEFKCRWSRGFTRRESERKGQVQIVVALSDRVNLNGKK